MICENCNELEATETAKVCGDHILSGVRLALCDGCVESEERPSLIVDVPARFEEVRAARQDGDHHMICSTPTDVPCPCIGYANEWDECCCMPADRRSLRSKCLGCGQAMFAIDVNSGEPLEAVS